ncbi:MAG: Fic family protein [Oligoflexales bacterium]|nr:Fic family protein [Oligoflexales bacterium]
MSFDISKLNNFQASLEMISNIGLIERFTGEWVRSDRLSPELIKSLKKTTIVTSSGASTRIENALMTDENVADFINQGCKITKLSSRSEREVAGYIKVLEYIYEGGHQEIISEHFIRTLHQLMTKTFSKDMLPDSQRGSYKNVPNDVVEKNQATGEEKIWFETTPPGSQTAAAMAELIKKYHEYINTILPKPIVIGWFIVHFLAIHPFRDGNGRLSRLLTIYLMMKNGYSWMPFVSHEKFIEDNKERYYVSLRETQKSFRGSKINYEPWLEFFVRVLQKQVRYLEEKVFQEQIEPKRIFGKNEKYVMQLLKDSKSLSRNELQSMASMSEKGMKLLLNRLIDRGEVERIGVGKSSRYRIKI